MSKQIMNVRDVMAVLEVSESKAYGIIRQMNDELKAKGLIFFTILTMRNWKSRARFLRSM